MLRRHGTLNKRKGGCKTKETLSKNKSFVTHKFSLWRRDHRGCEAFGVFLAISHVLPCYSYRSSRATTLDHIALPSPTAVVTLDSVLSAIGGHAIVFVM